MHSARFEIVCKRFCLPPLNSLLIPYRRPTHPCSPCSVAFLPLTIPQLTPLQSLSYSVQTSDLLPFNRFLTPLITAIQSHFYPLTIHPTYSPSVALLSAHKCPTYSPSIDFLLTYSLYVLSSSTILDPYKCPTYPSSNVLLTPYNRPTYPPSNALLIPYKPLSKPTSIECLFCKNVQVIPLQTR